MVKIRETKKKKLVGHLKQERDSGPEDLPYAGENLEFLQKKKFAHRDKIKIHDYIFAEFFAANEKEKGWLFTSPKESYWLKVVLCEEEKNPGTVLVVNAPIIINTWEKDIEDLKIGIRAYGDEQHLHVKNFIKEVRETPTTVFRRTVTTIQRIGKKNFLYMTTVENFDPYQYYSWDKDFEPILLLKDHVNHKVYEYNFGPTHPETENEFSFTFKRKDSLKIHAAIIYYADEFRFSESYFLNLIRKLEDNIKIILRTLKYKADKTGKTINDIYKKDFHGCLPNNIYKDDIFLETFPVMINVTDNKEIKRTKNSDEAIEKYEGAEEIKKVSNRKAQPDQDVIHPGKFIVENLVVPEGLKKGKMAERLGVDPATLSLLLNEKSNLSTEMAYRFELVYGLSYDELMALQAKHEKIQLLKKHKELKVFPVPRLTS